MRRQLSRPSDKQREGLYLKHGEAFGLIDTGYLIANKYVDLSERVFYMFWFEAISGHCVIPDFGNNLKLYCPWWCF